MKHLKRLLVGGALVASAVAVAQPAPPKKGGFLHWLFG